MAVQLLTATQVIHSKRSRKTGRETDKRQVHGQTDR